MFYIRVIYFWKEETGGLFYSISQAQEFLSSFGFKEIGESQLFWELKLDWHHHSFIAEIVKLFEVGPISHILNFIKYQD